MDKTKDLLKYKQISSIIAGVLNVLITYFILTLIYIFLLGESLFDGYDLLFFLIIGIGCSELGAILTIKYHKIKKQN